MTQFTSDDQTLALERGQRRPRSWQFWKAGKVLFLDYVVEELLGMGGSSIVYKVRNTLSDDRFALKVPKFSLSQDPRKNRLFFREIRTWIDLPDHPNLTACRFIRTMDDRMVIFAEYVDGGSLRDWIGLQQLLQIDEILDVAIQIAWGLETAMPTVSSTRT